MQDWPIKRNINQTSRGIFNSVIHSRGYQSLSAKLPRHSIVHTNIHSPRINWMTGKAVNRS